jgi:hypothetical protein
MTQSLRKTLLRVLMTVALNVSAVAFAKTPYPGDDWQLHKPGTNDEHVVDDYSECIMAGDAPPIMDSRTKQAITDPKVVETYQRYVLSCMGAKGYVLVPPTTKGR